MSEKPKQKRDEVSCFEKFSYRVVSATETFFYNLGYSVASKPWTVIAICLGVVLVSTIGFIRFHQEKNPFKLWVPSDSQFMHDTSWLINRFQNGYRDEPVLLKAPDVLTPEVLLKMSEIDQKIKMSVTASGIMWKDVCFRIPDLKLHYIDMLFRGGSRKSSNFDPSVYLGSATYCTLVESFDRACYEKNLLELWDYNSTKIASLTKQDILNHLDKYKINPLLGEMKTYEGLLGGITRNETGHIVSARALHTFYTVYVNFSAVDMDKVGNNAGTADLASVEGLEWEGEFLNVMHNISNNFEEDDMELFYMSARSFGDITNKLMFQDLDLVVIGVAAMIIYVQFVISKFNCVESRVMLACLGLMAVGMAFVVGCSICAVLGIYYGPVHTSLPFLLMGLGADDMFVIVSVWDNMAVEEKRLPLPERVGTMLKHAGVSISVTSVTDVLAFIVGASTILPCLQSFCIYAAVSVTLAFVFVVTFFTACFTLDERRLQKNRNGALICYSHKNYTRNSCSQRQISNKVFELVYSNVIFTAPFKVLVILLAVTSFSYSFYNCLKLEKKFDINFFLPKDSYMNRYLNARFEVFPTAGYEAGIFMGNVNYSEEIPNIRKMVYNLESSTDITSSVNSWVDPFRNYAYKLFKKDIYVETLSPNEFNLFLMKFLFSPHGAKFQANFRFDRELECGIPAPNITMSLVTFKFNLLTGPPAQVSAMHKAIDIAKGVNFTTGDKFSTAWMPVFATWVTNELIDIEVERNLELALLCVMIVTLPMISNIQMCFWIFICVLLTMVNVCGFMQVLGMSIDMVSCIGLELAIGLCVDYATHVGHTFMTIPGTSKEERSLRTVVTIGSAVLYGGISMLIAVSMLGLSDAYNFQVFYKIFVLVAIFGLFHGVVFLPVVLSLCGPKPYRTHNLLQQETGNIET